MNRRILTISAMIDLLKITANVPWANAIISSNEIAAYFHTDEEKSGAVGA